jgi:hypothetical protein
MRRGRPSVCYAKADELGLLADERIHDATVATEEAASYEFR